MGTSTSIAVLVFAVLCGYIALRLIPRNLIPIHMQHHPAQWIPELISEQHSAALNALIREMAEFPSNVDADLKTGGFVARHEHIGEAVPISLSPDGQQRYCDHPFLVPNVNRTHCILPQRVDIGRHFILTGGPDAIREPFERMISRVSSFGRYMLSENILTDYPVVGELFQQQSFQDAAKSICPAQQQVLDPFQFNFIIQVPGQTVATHIDGAYFWGATRKEFPQWLLACMVFSGLFADKFIHQVQVVGYLHHWHPDSISRSDSTSKSSSSSAGDFIYYADSSAQPAVMRPVPRSGALIDGSKTVHAAKVYRSEVDAPKLDKNAANVLTYVGNETWHLIQTSSNSDSSSNGNSDSGSSRVIATYDSQQLRISIVYRARCFASADEQRQFYDLQQRDEQKMQLQDILDTLKADVAASNNSRYSREQLDAMPLLQLALLLQDHYIAYPLPAAATAAVPYNFCALPKLLPWTAPLLRLIC